MALNVCVAGATGWAGSELARSIAKNEDLALVAAVARKEAGRFRAMCSANRAASGEVCSPAAILR